MNAVEYNPTAAADAAIELARTDDEIVDVVMQRYVDNLKATRKSLQNSLKYAQGRMDEYLKSIKVSFNKTDVETTCEVMGIQSILQKVDVVMEDDIKGPHYVATLGLIDIDLLTKGGHGTPQIYKLRHVPISTPEVVSTFTDLKSTVDYAVDSLAANNTDHCEIGDVEARVRSNLKRVRLEEAGHGALVNTDVLLKIHTTI